MQRNLLTLSALFLFLVYLSSFENTIAQPGPGYWQQAVDYQMEIDMRADWM